MFRSPTAKASTRTNRVRSKRRRRQLICETLEDRRLLAVVFSEGFETDGNGTRYTTTGLFADPGGDVYSRVNAAHQSLDGGGAGTTISLDGDQATYGGFTNSFFAIEDADGLAGFDGRRTIAFPSYATSSFENMTFSFDVAAGDSGSTSDGNPASDDDHFLAAIYSIDGGSNWIPGAIINVVGPTNDFTNKDFAVVNPPTFTGGGSLVALGNSINSNGRITSANTAPPLVAYDQFNNASAANTINANATNVSFAIPNAASVQVKLVMLSDDSHVELAFDNIVLNGDPILTNVAPSVSASNAANVTEANIGDTSYSFTVTYADDVAIDVSDIDINDVTVTGPGGLVPITNASVDIGTDGTPRTATYTITPPGGSWNAADNGTYNIDMVANEVSDTDGTPLFVSPGAITSFTVNATNTAPFVSDVLAEDVIFQNLGDTSYSFTITYDDTFHDINVSTIDINDVTVTKGGGGTLAVTGVTTDPAVNGRPVTATYTVTPPGGSWDAADNDTYTVALVNSQVADVVGGIVPADPNLATFEFNSNKVLNEGFETDGNGTRYTTTNEFSADPTDYFTRVFDGNGNTAGGESPAIDLDDATLDEYIDFERRVYFAAEDVDNSGTFAGFRVLDINPINTGAFTGLTFMGDFGAGDNTDGGPSYDGDHFMAVLVSTDGGATYIPKMVFRADVVAGDNTNFVARQVTTIAPGTDPTSDTLAELGAKMSAGQIMGSTATGPENAFDFMAAEGDGSGANGLLLGANLQTASVGLDDATETRVRIVVQTDDNNVEWAFDNLMIAGTFVGGNQAPIAQSAVANDVGEPNIGEVSYSFTITYADDSGIDVSTIDNNDVTVTGPGGAIAVQNSSVDIGTDGTPRTVTYSINAPGGSWDAADNGLYTIGIVGNQVGDDDGTQLFVAADPAFATFNVNATNTDPFVSNFLAEDVIFSDFGETSYSFTVEYSDVGGIDASTIIDVTDVTVTGPGGPLTVVSAVEPTGTNGSPKTTTYTVTPPGGSWDIGDFGTYTIGIAGNEIFDIAGASVPANASLTSFDVIPGKLLNETFETDGNGTRYTTTGEFLPASGGYYTRVTDSNGNAAGGETPAIDLDDLTLDEYIDFQGQTYFAAEDVDQGGGGAGFRVLDLDPIDTSLHTNLTFMGLFGAGDNTDGNPAYDGDHFMAVLVSTDGGATYIPKLVFRADVTAGDNTNFVARQVTTIAPGTDPTSDTLAELGLKLSGGQIMGSAATGPENAFDFIAAEGDGTGANGLLLGANLQTASVGLDDAAETRVRLVLNANDTNVEWAFDSLMVTGDVADITPPTLNAFQRNTPATSPTDADVLVFDILFDEPVNNVTADDFDIIGTTATGVIGGGGAAYTLTVSGGDLAGLNGIVELDLAGTQDITDLVGNMLPNAQPAIDETYQVVNLTPPVGVFLNEILIDPAGTDAPNEYIELRGPANQSLDDVFLVFVEGDSESPLGTINSSELIDLSGVSIGANGFLVIVDGSGGSAHPYSIAGGTTIVDIDGLDFENASWTAFLIHENGLGTDPAAGQDLDTGDDGLDALPTGWTILDGVSVLDGGTTDRAYADIVFSSNADGLTEGGATFVNTGFGSDQIHHVMRIGDTTGSTTADWVAFEHNGTAPHFGVFDTTNLAYAFDVLITNHLGASNPTSTAPPIVNLALTTNTASETAGTVITVTANVASIVPVDQTVDLVVTGPGITPTDFSLTNSTITILAGAMSGQATFTVEDDGLVESLVEQAVISLDNPSLGITLGPNFEDFVNITDNDSATISVGNVSQIETDSGQTAFTFVATLDKDVDTAVNFSFETVDGTATVADSDYNGILATANTFAGPAGTLNLVVQVNGDMTNEAAETFFVRLSNLDASGRDVQFAGGGATVDGTGTILNDDAPQPIRFDFNKSQAATAAGTIGVLPTDTYNATAGYGWSSPGVIERFDTGVGNDLRRDYHFFRVGARTFRVDLPDGDYEVTPTIGSTLHRFENTGVIIDGTQVDQFTTEPGDFVTPTYMATVTGGKLELTIERQGGTFVAINGLTIVSVGGAPTINTSPGSRIYNTGDPALAVDPALTVSDPDSANFLSASVSIIGGHVPSEDLLEFTNQNGITGSFVGATGVLSLSGSASVADYQTALRSVAYRNSSGTPTFQMRTMSFQVFDGSSVASATKDVEVVDPNAVVGVNYDFDKSTSSATAIGFTQVLPTTAYNATSGFGWVAPAGIEQFDTGVGNPTELLRDYHFFRVGSRTFRSDLPNGAYDVTFDMGSTIHKFENVGVIINGTQVDTLTTLPGNFVSNSYRVAVTNGRIELTVERQGGTFVAINALSIIPESTAPNLQAAAGHARPDGPVNELTESQLESTLEEAIGIWAATGLSAAQVDMLRSVDVVVADLGGNRLGEATSSLIRIDDDASGLGWASDDSDGTGSMDLLTTVLHELGHVLGHDHSDDIEDLMHDFLSPGESRLLDQRDGAFADWA